MTPIEKCVQEIEHRAQEPTAESLKILGTHHEFWAHGKRSPQPFAPALLLNAKGRRELDLGQESADVLPLANAASQALRRIAFQLRGRRDDQLTILSTGDSWFQYPFFLKDVIDHLDDHHRIYSLGAGGAMLRDIVGDARVLKVMRDIRPDALLLSGGGNDMLGQVDGKARLSDFLLPHVDQTAPAEYINKPAWTAFLREITGLYRNLIRSAHAIDPQLHVVLHSYAYSLPQKGGAWLGVPLAKAKTPEEHWPGIIRHLIDGLHSALTDLAADFDGKVSLADVRAAVASDAWHDELHPTNAGFGMVSVEFRTLLDDIFRKLRGGAPIGVQALPGAATDDGPEANSTAAASPDEWKRHARGAGWNLCGDLDAWRAVLSETDRAASAAAHGLLAALDRPEDPERVRQRIALRAYAGAGSDPNAQSLIGENDLQQISFLERGARAARAVGFVRTVTNDGSPDSAGTGFLVGEGLLLTNNHVLDETTAARSRVDFDYQRAPDGDYRPRETFATRPELFVTDAALDFTFIGLQERSRQGAPLARYGALHLVPESGKALKSEHVSIIQHPGGREKQIALRNSRVLGVHGDHLYYDTDTQQGSSGAPVLNDQWYPVALHHRTVPDYDKACTWVANRGVRISAIFKRLREIAADGADPQRGAAMQVLDRLSAHDLDAGAPEGPTWRGTPAFDENDRAPHERMPPPLAGYEALAAPALLPHPTRSRLLDRDPRHMAVLRHEDSPPRHAGTVVAVGPKLVLSAAHVIKSAAFTLRTYDDAGNANDLAQRIGFDDARSQRVCARDDEVDFGGVRLRARHGLSTWLTPEFVAGADLAPSSGRGPVEIEILGYAAASRTPLIATGFIEDVRDGRLFYCSPVSGGMSGGPIVLAGTSRMIGVHSGGPAKAVGFTNLLDVNVGVHIDRTLIKEIDEWNT